MNRIYICIAFIFCTSAMFAEENRQEADQRTGQISNQGVDREISLEADRKADQESRPESRPEKLLFSGQLSAWGQFSPDIPTKVWLGGRYIPQLNFSIPLENKKLFDLEVSANLFGDLGIQSGNTSTDGKIKPYRAWARYSSTRTEVRLGLQKINFGSAQMFRPLMWFDSMDPRDPLQLTDGVWGGLFRYYFPTNATLWLWSLYGNDNRKGWEILPSSNSFPEMGGRAQIPIPKGEGAVTYHFRKADGSMYGQNEINENRFGFDIRMDVTAGLWLEGSWTKADRNIGNLTNQQMMTLGTDYTFGIGNGLGLTFEQFFYSYGEKGIHFDNSLNFSGLNLSYPLTMLDNISAMLYYDWKNNTTYNFLNWQRQLNHLTFHLIGYWNPGLIGLPSQMGATNRFAGKGLQVMVVWNH